MFTGIVTAIGQIRQAAPLGAGSAYGVRLTLQTPAGYLDDVAPGDSIALNGACMTVTALDAPAGRFDVEVSAESLARAYGQNAPCPAHLEKALRAQDRLGGHIVSGHVDGIGQVLQLAAVGESWLLRVRAPRELAPFLAYKGSVAVNGVSLTINSVQDSAQGCEFSINLIAHTVQHTTLGQLAAGSAVNLEIDTVARYVQRMLGLRENG